MNAVQVEVTSRCNAFCAYCPRTVLHGEWFSRDMSMGLFTRIVDGIRGKVGLVYLQGWGEPLLNPDILEMIRLARRKLDAEVGLTTNGTLLDDSRTRGLLGAGLDTIGVSFAGGSAATHKELRRGCDFDRVVSNTKALVKEKNEAGNNLRVIASYLMAGKNVREMPRFASLCGEIGVTELTFTNLAYIPAGDLFPLRAFGCHGEGPDPEVEASAAEAKEVAESLGMKAFVYGLSCRELAICPDDPCGTAFINVGGEVSPCVFTNLPTRSSTVTRVFAGATAHASKVAFGNAGSEDLDAIWNGEEYGRFRAIFDGRMKMATDPTELLSPLFEQAPFPALPACCRTCYRILNV